MNGILATAPIPAPGMDILRTAGPVDVLPGAPTESELAALLASGDHSVLVAHLSDNLSEQVLDNAVLRGIATYSAGVNNIDIAAATRRGILVANTPDVLTEATADIALLLMLATARRGVEADRFLRAGSYHGWQPDLLLGQDMSGQTLGLAGFGRIAQATARRALGFGMRVLYCARPPHKSASSSPEPTDLTGRVARTEWRELVETSDFLSLHVPLTADTHHLVDKGVLAAMKPAAILVNTARGPVVDESALVKALSTGQIAGAGLDVYENEPALSPGLTELANTVLLPHIGSATHSVRSAMAQLCARNAVSLQRGKVPATAVNPQAWQ